MVVRQQRVLGLRSDVYLSSLDPDRNMEFHRAHLNTGTMQLLVMGGKIHFSKKNLRNTRVKERRELSLFGLLY